MVWVVQLNIRKHGGLMQALKIATKENTANLE